MSSEIDRGVRIADKYEIVGPLGQGAYGSVYRAIQHPVERTVALKVISPHAATDEALRARFFREARAIARLNHPGVVTLHDYGDSNGTLYMVMEYVDGLELKQLIKRDAPMEPARALDYVRQVVTVLVEANELDLIHRDLKPANIMIVQDAAGEERVKILDFGIAKLLDDRRARFQTQMGTVVGSPSYFSPEQAMGEPCGPSADQYSVGVILYEMLTGRKPFNGNSLMALINAHRFETMPPLAPELGLPLSVTAFLRRALEKQPADRFPDARAMLEGVDTLMRQFVVSERPSGQRPVVDSRGPRRGPERRKTNTAPLPGLDVDEQQQSSEQLVSSVATMPDPMPGIRPPEGPAGSGSAIEQTAALIALGSAHELYEAADALAAADAAASEAPRPEAEPADLPGIEVFNASSTIVKPPPPKAPRSPLQIALLVGGSIALLGLLGMWLISRGRQPPAEMPADVGAVVDAAPAAVVVEPDAALVDAAAPGVNVADGGTGDGGAGDGGADAGADGAPADAAADATPVEAAPRPVRRRQAPVRRPPPPRDPYQKL